MKSLAISLEGKSLLKDEKAAMGIGSLIIFIAMILVAGIAASVMLQTMNSLEQKAMTTGQETIRDISTGIRVTHETGYSNTSKINRLAVFIKPIAGSDGIDLGYAYLQLSDTNTQVILNYTSNIFSDNLSGGVFSSVNFSNLSASTYGVVVVRDTDDSCSSNNPVINENDLVALVLNCSKCFNGLSTRTKVTGKIVPEYGISGVLSFTTPSSFVDTIIEL